MIERISIKNMVFNYFEMNDELDNIFWNHVNDLDDLFMSKQRDIFNDSLDFNKSINIEEELSNLKNWYRIEFNILVRKYMYKKTQIKNLFDWRWQNKN